MGWSVVLDPYVAWLADTNPSCQKIVRSIYLSAEHAFVLDKGEVLLGKYEELASNNQEGVVSELYKHLVESRRSSKIKLSSHVLIMAPQIPALEYCCDGDDVNEVEKVMVGLASDQKSTALVTLDVSSRSKCAAPWLFWGDDCYQKVCDGHKVCFKFTDSWDWLGEPHHPVPNTKQSLDEFLKQYGDGAIRETEQLEFKCPNNPGNELTSGLIEETRKAICAMANLSAGGYVFVGVQDDGSIPGVSLSYRGQARSTDEMLRILLRDHHQFKPDHPVDHQWFIKVTEDRYVFVFRIGAMLRKNCTYKDIWYVRKGTQSLAHVR